MIQLRVHTEYNFRHSYGKLDAVLDQARGAAMAITDRGTWGHVQFYHKALKRGIRPLLGAEVAVIPELVAQRLPYRSMVLLARTSAGLSELYGAMTKANAQHYYWPRLTYADINQLSDEVLVLAGPHPDLTRLTRRENVFLELQPSAPVWTQHALRQYADWPTVVTADNAYPAMSDRTAYEVMMGREAQYRTTPMHLPTEDEFRLAIPGVTDAHFALTERIASLCQATLPKAENVHYPTVVSLRSLCETGAGPLGIDLTNPVYAQRLERELALIEEKRFTDYFLVIADMVQTAKQTMLVGPARGSSAGSLVCYLTGITDVDPIKHQLMFERFIDVTRADLPDIDIDFPDLKREQVITHLQQRYGAANVGRIGTISRYKAKSAIGDVAKALGIPLWDLKDFTGAIIERSTGDARAQFCLADALELDIGKATLAKYPGLAMTAALEGHARHSGMHAAGLIVANQPVSTYCTIDHTGAAQLDKYDAERLGILKIDALGLRTLTVLEDVLDQLGRPAEWLRTYPLDDAEAFAVFNAERWAGLFQFEGYALQSLTRQMKVQEFTDIVAITALARPGPLHCGAATDFIQRRIGREPIQPLHALAEPLTADSYGIVIYQEQVMAVGRVIGQLSWEDVSQLRKAMSKSLGEEFFNQYWVKFEAGAITQGLASDEARAIWEKICTFGSWAFNKSHAVSYGLLSYWCAVLKARHPLEFAAACLRHAKDEPQSQRLLRELLRSGVAVRPFDPARSQLDWTVQDGVLLGGLLAVKGIGPAKAKALLRARDSGTLTVAQRRLLAACQTPYDDLFEGQRCWGVLYDPTQWTMSQQRGRRVWQVPLTPERQLTLGPMSDGDPPVVVAIETIQDNGEYVFLGKLMEKNLRDLNEYGNVVKRGGRLVERNNLFLNLMLEDDSGSILATIDRWLYPTLGKPIIEAGKIGDWYLWRGIIAHQWRKVLVRGVRWLGPAIPLPRAPLPVEPPAPPPPGRKRFRLTGGTQLTLWPTEGSSS